MAKAGSCKIGLKPNPFGCAGKILSKGFEVTNVNNKKPIMIKAWVYKAFEINAEFIWLYNLNIK